MNSTWLITSELADQRAQKVLFTYVVYTNANYSLIILELLDQADAGSVPNGLAQSPALGDFIPGTLLYF